MSEKRVVTYSDFKMSREMVERYVRMINEVKRAVEDVNNLFAEYDEPNWKGKGRLEELVSTHLESVLYFEDGTHILDDWDRAEQLQKQRIDKIIKLGEVKCTEFAETIDIKGYCGRSEKTIYTPYNIVAKEFNEFWSPLLSEEGSYEISTFVSKCYATLYDFRYWYPWDELSLIFDLLD